MNAKVLSGEPSPATEVLLRAILSYDRAKLDVGFRNCSVVAALKERSEIRAKLKRSSEKRTVLEKRTRPRGKAEQILLPAG